ncbi:MAG: HK97 family phage prohead protease [Clostridia bacterium]|nr:HK97 family phage prohead protease [Clostridia bacterium]
MPIRNDREYRKAAPFEAREDESYIVEGYASTFSPYVLWHEGDTEIREQIDPHAFDNADMSDVIMQYDHEGRIFARQSNGTLELSVDAHGLKVRADLSKTEGARQLYEDIKSGMVTQMSFAFSIQEDAYDKEEHLRTVTKIRKLYDVSAVSIPANPGTEIQARSFFDGVIEAERAERLAAEERERKVKELRLRLSL